MSRAEGSAIQTAKPANRDRGNRRPWLGSAGASAPAETALASYPIGSLVIPKARYIKYPRNTIARIAITHQLIFHNIALTPSSPLNGLYTPWISPLCHEGQKDWTVG